MLQNLKYDEFMRQLYISMYKYSADCYHKSSIYKGSISDDYYFYRSSLQDFTKR